MQTSTGKDREGPEKTSHRIPKETEMTINRLAAVYIAIIITGSALGADFWEKKDYTTWSLKECNRLLENSPWVMKYTMARITSVRPMGNAGRLPTTRSIRDSEFGSDSGESGDSGVSSLSDREVFNTLTFRLVTAKPIKMAIGRLRLLSDPDNEELKKEVARYVETDDEERIAVEVYYSSKPAGHESLRHITAFLHQMTPDQLRNTVYLAANEMTTHIPVSQYLAPSENAPTAILIFPKKDPSGRPYFKGDEKRIIFHFELDLTRLGDSRKHIVDINLAPSKMKFNGVLEM